VKKMLFVMNPYAGVRRAARYLTDILSVFNRAGFDIVAPGKDGAFGGEGSRLGLGRHWESGGI